MVLGVRAVTAVAVLLLSLARLLVVARQPWPVQFDRAGSCCSSLGERTEAKFILARETGALLNESSALTKCVSSLSTQVPTTATVAVLSLTAAGEGDHRIPDIELYRGHHLFLLSAFAEHRGYMFRGFTSLPEHLPAEADFRWHKLPLMQNALRSDGGWARTVDFLVWMDSDAIVIDFGLDIEALGAQHPTVDIFASADVKLGLVNTGVLILRNTVFTRSFLSSWHSITDRATRCDQEAFDLAYATLTPADQARILILPTDAINSHPPAWEHLLPESPVLHLMGESAAYRAKVFQTAANSLCQARSAGILAPQLSLTRDGLQHQGREVYRELTQTAFRAANESHAMADEIATLVLQSHRYLDLLTLQASSALDTQSSVSVSQGIAARRLKREVLSVREGVFRLVLHKVEIVRRVLYGEVDDVDEDVVHAVRKSLPSTALQLDMLVRLLKQAAEEGNALFWALSSLPEREHVATLCFQLLDQLLALVADPSAGSVHHMHALMHQNLGAVYVEAATGDAEPPLAAATSTKGADVRSQLLDKATEHLRSSLDLFRHKVSLSNEAVASERYHSLQLLAAAQCAQHTLGPLTQPLWQEAIAEARQLAGQQPASLVARERLAIALSNAAHCYRDSPQLPARELARESVHELDTLLAAWEGRGRGGSKEGGGGVQAARWRDLRTHAQRVHHTLPPPEMRAESVHGHMQYLRGDEEWEECTDDMLDCEDFVVVQAEASPGSPTPRPAHNLLSHDLEEAPYFLSDDALMYVHLTPDEAAELRQVRAQYAHMAHSTVRYRDSHDVWDLVLMGAHPPSDVHSESAEAAVKNTSGVTHSSPSPSAPTLATVSEGACATQDRALAALQQEVQTLRAQNAHYRRLLKDIHDLSLPPR